MSNLLPNSLIHSRSIYLKQHAYNPIHWLSWGEDSLARAAKEQKLVIVSIGYAACHWCHVMERECFNDPEVAEIMNEHFICIKVDREERPDVDAVYMDAVQALHGSGGWPLNCICLPNGKPIYGGTYFPKNQWIKILLDILNLVTADPERAFAYAEEITQVIQQNEKKVLTSLKHISTDINFVKLIFQSWKSYLDFEFGGSLHTPKFPLPHNWLYLLRFGVLSQDSAALSIVETTLDAMASGGIYDQIGSGFARYSTDNKWFIPHFEKMLYDNTQLISLYAEAYRYFQKPVYQEVAENTIRFIQRELKQRKGYASSIDADSEHIEGLFYVWKYADIQVVLGGLAAIACDFYGCTEAGNWEHGNNILAPRYSDSEMAKKLAISEQEWKTKRSQINHVLFENRKKRVHPTIDDKIITSWNALFISSLVESYKSFQKEEYLFEAMALADTIVESSCEDFQVFRCPIAESDNITGFLDDYAFLIRAFIDLYQVTFEGYYLEQANNWLLYVDAHFRDETTGFYWFSSTLMPPLIVRKQEIHDTVIPSSNAQMAHNLWDLGIFLDKPEWKERAKKMLLQIAPKIETYPSIYSHWAILLLKQAYPDFQVSIVGKDALTKMQFLWKKFIPNILFSGSYQKSFYPLLRDKFVLDKTLIYTCQGEVCYEPDTSCENALQKIQTNFR
ncbi:MAG: thioredoxin domain-containing protein [Bacteroidia bacterium]|nr:thioredoxin domain-containing protein [Bacteroidia bacterium]